jgi:hypothetical protein
LASIDQSQNCDEGAQFGSFAYGNWYVTVTTEFDYTTQTSYSGWSQFDVNCDATTVVVDLQLSP